MERVNSVAELIERTRYMPLARMRFFINEDRNEPRCFGIYQDPANGHWVVYKNKADGSRAVRYSGPDEGYAAQELWAKINSEIELRRGPTPKKKVTPQIRRNRIIFGIVVGLIVALWLFHTIREVTGPSRGYYVRDDDVYYYQNDRWYAYDDGSWMYCDATDMDDWYRDSYYGQSHPSQVSGVDAFEKSPYYVEPSDNDSVFDTWDAGDTDWDTDW